MIEPLLTAIAQIVPGALCYHAADLRLRFFNETYAKLYERLAGRRPQLGELTADSLNDPDLRTQVAEDRRRAAAGEPVKARYTLCFGETAEIWEVCHQPVWDADGRVIGTLALGQNITAQKREQGFLQCLELILSQLHDMALVMEACPIDAAAAGPRIIYANEMLERATGYSRSEVIEQTPRILQGPRAQRDQLDKLRVALERREPTRVELVNYRKDGQELIVDLSLSLITNSSGKAGYWVGIQRDVTKERNLVATLRRALEERQILLQEIHHRVKNNLQTVISLLELHAAGRDNYPLEELLGDARARILAIALIHEQLCQQSDFSRVSLDSLARLLVESIQLVFAGAPLNVRLVTAPLTISLNQAVPVALIAHKLITNSFRHGVAAGAQNLVVQLHQSAGVVTLEVIDDGVRHPPDLAMRLANRKRLGLNLARLLARQIDGEISFDVQPGRFRAAVSFPFRKFKQ
ncbi:MAG: hypothetical protein CFK52_11550 [Chloracidobacterium sp. CP2_5A]|nr:MAG: hypothetical protein CFK52_11550 [Chloracidobacterium sp. CP2_5A]